MTKPFILYVGGRIHYKNFDLLAQAFSIWPLREHFQLVVVGSALNTREEKKLRDLKIYESVCVVTGVDDALLCQLYNLAVAFVYPSLYEGFGIPLLEAMSCGCLIVASRIPTTEEIALDIPFYFDPTSVDELTQALTQASRGKDMQRIEAGLKRAKMFSWDKTAQETLNVYQRVSLEK